MTLGLQCVEVASFALQLLLDRSDDCQSRHTKLPFVLQVKVSQGHRSSARGYTFTIKRTLGAGVLGLQIYARAVQLAAQLAAGECRNSIQ